MKRKKSYRSPFIELVTIDRELVLLQTSASEDTGPGHPDPDTAPPQQNSFDKNNLNNNPFEK